MGAENGFTASRSRGVPLAVKVLACTAWALGCGGDDGTAPQPPDPPRPTTVVLSPATSELAALGATVQLAAEVRDQNGNVMGGAALTWVSSSTAVATVNASGLVTAAGNGTATITATAGTVSGSATVTVSQQVGAVEITPDTGIVLPGTKLQLAAEAQDANGHAVAGSEFVWESSDTAVAVVDSTGLVSGIALGAVEVSATSSGVTGRAQLEVVEPAPTTVAVRPDTVMFDALGDTLRLVAEVQDQAGRPLPDEAIMWATSDTRVATVNDSGLVTAAGNGAAMITATSGTLSDEAAVEVMQVPRRVTVSPSADTLILGDSLRLAAEALDGNGHPVAGAAFTWSSGDAAIATVDTLGLVRGVGEGTAEIAAAAGDVQGVARLTVFSPDRAPLVALYNATDGPNWVNSDNWLTDEPLAQWHGVRTDAVGRVIWVRLHGQRDSQGNWTRNGLKGTIPLELGRLDKLKGLWLYGNEISGSIPPELGDLDSLELLDLSHNELAGPTPPELASLFDLKRPLASRQLPRGRTAAGVGQPRQTRGSDHVPQRTLRGASGCTWRPGQPEGFGPGPKRTDRPDTTRTRQPRQLAAAVSRQQHDDRADPATTRRPHKSDAAVAMREWPVGPHPVGARQPRAAPGPGTLRQRAFRPDSFHTREPGKADRPRTSE